MSEPKNKVEPVDLTNIPINTEKDFKARVEEVIRLRHDSLMKTLNQEVSIANRYEIRIRVEELLALYNELFANTGK